MAPNIEDIEEEQRQFSNVISTFHNYERYSLSANNRRRKDIYTLPRRDQELLDGLGYKQKLDAVDKAILVNAEFLAQIVEDTDLFQGDDQGEEQIQIPPHHDTHSTNQDRSHSYSHDLKHGSHGKGNIQKKYKPTDFDFDKLRSTLKQFVRDWSSEGKIERDSCYEPLKEALVAHYAHVPPEERHQLRVLVPGAGLGRLAFDVAKLGFSCQGNEFSHYMLLSSFFVLNKTTEIKKHTIYPYVHSFSNAPNQQSILQAISIPDVLPSDLPEGSNFSLVAGDFEEIYGTESDPQEPQHGKWDAILTCFFIDTAKNIVNYLRIIHQILALGGIWINLGPLLWHWENNNTNDPSIELDMQELKTLMTKMGFEISNERAIDTTYTNNAQSMLGYVYKASMWTATKKS
ncbi:N2227-like protein-domain-containing protein [Crepidotus variabilis]|uniref:carnosine N-methyltransferase n=1 Tax=Crepidotus variabilis TaxID=179855 RepID=A0A9P6JSW0_9AGAR|nr:N2227-like protein-domain-containing protein [Crepidotus variabilis]